MIKNISKVEVHYKNEELIRQLYTALDKNTRIDLLMHEENSLIMKALNAEGFIVKAYVHTLSYGKIPENDLCNKLINWLKNYDEEFFYTDSASSFFKDIPELNILTGSILAVPISRKSNEYIIWFCNTGVEEVVWNDTYIRTAQRIANILLESEKLSAQQANIAKTEFLANMSHEIRTPMNAVVGLTHILLSSNPLTEIQQEMLNTLQISANTLLELINDLLDISKIESRNLELESISFNIKKLLQEVISINSVKAHEKGTSFNLKDSDSFDKNYIGDPLRIRQVIMNLCSNAVKFTENGNINISVKTLESSKPQHEKILISIKDSGIGIAPEKIGTIFQKFTQADKSVSRIYGGTGLGLAITKMLVDAMGGKITVESELGKGSEFTVCIDLEVSSEI